MSDNVVIIRQPQTTVVKIAIIERIVVKQAGIQGVKGDQGTPGATGPAGANGVGFQSTDVNFASPSTQWIWVHNLNTKAFSVTCFEPDGSTEKEGSVSFPDFNTIQVDWYFPESGILRVLY